MDNRRIVEMAKKDAHDYAYATANYGKGAGNRRKVVQMRVDERMSNPLYRSTFQEELSKIKYEPIVDKIEKRKTVEKVYTATKKTVGFVEHACNWYDRNRDVISLIARKLLR